MANCFHSTLFFHHLSIFSLRMAGNVVCLFKPQLFVSPFSLPSHLPKCMFVFVFLLRSVRAFAENQFQYCSMGVKVYADAASELVNKWESTREKYTDSRREEKKITGRKTTQATDSTFSTFRSTTAISFIQQFPSLAGWLFLFFLLSLSIFSVQASWTWIYCLVQIFP